MILTLTTDDGEVIDEWNLDFPAYYTHVEFDDDTWNLNSAMASACLWSEILNSAQNRARYDRDERKKEEA